jgi:ketosteroid isomerase-like protein
MIKALGLVALAAIPLVGQDANIEAVRRMTRELEQALTHADMTTLDKMVVDDFIRTPPGGRDTSKSEWLGLVQSGRLQYVAFEDSDVRFRSYGNTVVVNNVSNIHTRSSGGPERQGKLKLVWVWVKLDGQWKLAGVEGTQVTAPAQ